MGRGLYRFLSAIVGWSIRERLAMAFFHASNQRGSPSSVCVFFPLVAVTPSSRDLGVGDRCNGHYAERIRDPKTKALRDIRREPRKPLPLIEKGYQRRRKKEEKSGATKV